MVRLRTLTPSIEVRIHAGHPLRRYRPTSVLATAFAPAGDQLVRGDRRPLPARNSRSRCQMSRPAHRRSAQTPVARPARKAAPKRGRFEISRPLDRELEDVGEELAQPGVGRHSAVDPQRRRRGAPSPRHGLDQVERLIGDRLERGAGEMRAGRVERQAEDRAARIRVPMRRAEADEGRAPYRRRGYRATRVARLSVSAASAITPSPSRSHLTAAPATKIDPSSA